MTIDIARYFQNQQEFALSGGDNFKHYDPQQPLPCRTMVYFCIDIFIQTMRLVKEMLYFIL